MKRITGVILFLSCLTTILYSQEISEKEGRKVLEQIRREIQFEEKAKQKAIEEAEKARIAAEKEKEKKGKKILEDIRRDMNESLEEKVFRSENDPEVRAAAFETGRERMAFLKMEEKEIMDLEKDLGIEGEENRVFLSQKFDEVYEEFNSKNAEVQNLSDENKKLNEYLTKLDRMEQKVKTGK